MLFAAINVAGSLVGVGTLLVGVATMFTAWDNRQRAKRLEKGQTEIHKAVNGNATAERARSSQLVGALSKAGIEVPDPPTPIAVEE